MTAYNRMLKSIEKEREMVKRIMNIISNILNTSKPKCYMLSKCNGINVDNEENDSSFILSSEEDFVKFIDNSTSMDIAV
jgi:RNase adaptor protein for sRNA GlmZ degradation